MRNKKASKEAAARTEAGFENAFDPMSIQAAPQANFSQNSDDKLLEELELDVLGSLSLSLAEDAESVEQKEQLTPETSNLDGTPDEVFPNVETAEKKNDLDGPSVEMSTTNDDTKAENDEQAVEPTPVPGPTGIAAEPLAEDVSTSLTTGPGALINIEKQALAPEPVLKPIFRSDGQQVPNHRLGRYVWERKQISADALDAASREQQVTGKPIGQILVKNGFLTDRQRVEAILAVEESRISQEQVSRSRIPVQLHDQYSIIISAEHDETIFVASPYSEDEIRTIVSEYYPEKQIEFVSYDPSAMARFITTMKRSAAVEDIRETKETMLDRLVFKALEMSASDIHITPQPECYSVQFRIDGVKRLIRMGPLDEYHTVMAQVKDKATIDLAEKRKAQDGSYQVEYNGKMIDLRVATLPVQNGEHVTIRVLDSDRVHPNLDKLGITEVAKWRRGFKQRDGICIIAGATNSGKTTTLNSSLREIDRFGKAIFTVEDPVEYRVPYVNQVSINAAVGLDFAAAVKAFMRNNPDVIILGEVRDAETARNAVKAADTGHLVMITLHTGSIMGAISRMKDLGVEPRELRYMLRTILVQSLIPKLCQTCHGHEDKLHSCKACKGEKYTGLTVASECEYFENVQDVDRLLNARNDTLSGAERTWTTMAEDAVNKMRAGITDVAGLERVFGSQIYQHLTDEEKLLCSNL